MKRNRRRTISRKLCVLFLALMILLAAVPGTGLAAPSVSPVSVNITVGQTVAVNVDLDTATDATATSGDASVATVSPATLAANGQLLITGVAAGSTTITANFSASGAAVSSETIAVTVMPQSYTITAGATEGGTISPSGSIQIAPGGAQVFSVQAHQNYLYTALYVDSVNVGAPGSYTFTNLSADHTIQAVFTQPPKYGITVDNDGHGAAGASVRASVGSRVELTAEPYAGYRFDRWEVISGGSLSDLDATDPRAVFTMPERTVHLMAHFKSLSSSSGGQADAASSTSTSEAGPRLVATVLPGADGTALCLVTSTESTAMFEWQVRETGGVWMNMFVTAGFGRLARAVGLTPGKTYEICAAVYDDSWNLYLSDPVSFTALTESASLEPFPAAAIVNLTDAPVYAEASADAATNRMLPFGSVVELVGYHADVGLGWYAIALADGTAGYIAADAVDCLFAAPLAVTLITEAGVYVQPTEEYDALIMFAEGTELDVVGRTGEWCLFELGGDLLCIRADSLRFELGTP